MRIEITGNQGEGKSTLLRLIERAIAKESTYLWSHAHDTEHALNVSVLSDGFYMVRVTDESRITVAELSSSWWRVIGDPIARAAVHQVIRKINLE